MQPKQTIIARRRLRRRQRDIGRGRGSIFLYSTMAKFLALFIGCCFITTLYLMYTLDNHYDGQPDRNLLQEVVKKFERIIYKSASIHDHVDSETRSSLDIKPFFRGEQTARRGLGSTARASAGDGLLAITAVVQISFHPTKLQRLLDLASRWKDGYISVIVYVCDEESPSVLEHLESYVREHASLFEKTVIQIVTDRRPKASRQYPINILRNMGVENAPTDHVIVLDVDLVPNVGAYADLVKHLSLNTVSREKTALILPSFERSLAKDEDESSPIEAFHIPDTKSDLIPHIVMPKNGDDDINDGSVAEGKISPFHVEIFRQGHGPTKFEKWITTLNQYQVEYAPFFEPYFVVNKQNGLPPFWEYFQGYGFNKYSWVAELHAAGWKFIVAPNSFLVHIDHDYSTNKSSRTIRDKMAEEFVLGFVPYIKKEYGSNPFSWDDLSHSDVIMDTLKELGYDRESWNH